MIMNTFLVLLALLGVAVAQAPDTCPAPPKNLLCFIGLKNTCTDSIKCRKGTLCCDDGCRRRCRDPSNDSRGAGQASPRSGTCPSQLSPPPGPCVSDSDECMFDWDCPGSTKKCCSNNCFKECVDPSIGGLRASCPPQKKSISCFINLKNQCSKDSDCSYLPGGLCCFDGCRRRCADSKGFPGRLETDRPGQCPSTKPPRPCISDSDECEFDGDCYPGKKCCDNTCFTRCLDPVGLGTNTSQSGLGPNIGEIIQGEAAGKCPIVSNSTRCHIGLAHTCNNDVECPNGTYCCFDGCRRKCLDTEGNSAGAQGEDKKGLCPVLQRPELCVSDVDECFIDWDCVGDMKCCSNECYKVCTAPALLIGRLVAAAVKCPEPVAYKRCPQSMKHLCDDSKQCPTGTHCCFDGCRRRCISTEPAPGTCPKAGKNLICPVGLRNTCVDKDSCLEGTICCHDGCRRRCRSLPSSTSRPSTKAIPRPGICPPLTPPSEFCPSDYDECKYDWDCDEPSKKCCSNGCYKICASPAVAAVQLQDNCPAPEKPKPCPMTLRNQCFNHTDCSYLSGGLCCYDGCRTRCATAEGFPAQIQKPRPGNCPNLIQPEFCAPHFDECQNDGDCFPVKKCCSNNCFNRCVNPVFGDVGFVNTTSVNKCPDTKKSSTCHVGLKNTCNNDAECANGTYCCFTGCRRQCWDPKTRSSSTLNKKGTCPVLQSPPPPCVSDADECFMDNDCVKDKKCCSNGCYRICVPPSAKAIGSLTTVNCPQPTEYHCATSLKHQCDDTEDCSVDQVCCFDGCRRRCIDYESGQITKGVTVSCRKNEMQIDVERGVLTGFKPIYLRLNNRSCIATGNETHFSLVAPLMGCGTVSSHTGEDVVYSNQVEEEEVEIEGVISRMPELAIPFSCYYTKEGVTSTYGIIPRKLKMTMDGGETKTEFTLEISVFKDENYLLPFGIRDFPLKVSLGKPLFVQLAVDSPDTRLTIREEKCYATPTQNPDDVMQYYIIRQSCVVDSTVKYYPGPQGTRRFSFDTFQFTGEYGGFVYLHCKLVVCNATDPNSRCNVDCFTDFPRRSRRAMEKEKGVARAGLSEGPFVFKSEREGDKESVHSEEESPFNITTIVVVAMAIFCAVCLAVIVYMKVKFVPKPHPDPDRETSL